LPSPGVLAPPCRRWRVTRRSQHSGGSVARITIEDCTERVPNRFHLVQMTAIRAKQLKKGARPLVHAEENKAVVVALREVAAGFVTPDYPEELEPDTTSE